MYFYVYIVQTCNCSCTCMWISISSSQCPGVRSPVWIRTHRSILAMDFSLRTRTLPGLWTSGEWCSSVLTHMPYMWWGTSWRARERPSLPTSISSQALMGSWRWEVWGREGEKNEGGYICMSGWKWQLFLITVLAIFLYMYVSIAVWRLKVHSWISSHNHKETFWDSTF